jgi:hypothetical protein
MSKPPRVALVGCGFIGRKRFNYLPPGSIVVACDLNLDRTKPASRNPS